MKKSEQEIFDGLIELAEGDVYLVEEAMRNASATYEPATLVEIILYIYRTKNARMGRAL